MKCLKITGFSSNSLIDTGRKWRLHSSKEMTLGIVLLKLYVKSYLRINTNSHTTPSPTTPTTTFQYNSHGAARHQEIRQNQDT